MIIALTISNLLLLAAVVYLYLRQLRFEKLVRQFAARLPEMLSPPPMLKGAAVGFLALVIIKKLFFNSNKNDNETLT